MKVQGSPPAASYPKSHVKYETAKAGDTLRSLSERAGVPVEHIVKNNPDKEKNPDAPLKKGTTFVIPEQKHAAPKHDAPRKADGTLASPDKAVDVPAEVEAKLAAAARRKEEASHAHVEPRKAEARPPAPPRDNGRGAASADAALVKGALQFAGTAKNAAGGAAAAEADESPIGKVPGGRDTLDTLKDTPKALAGMRAADLEAKLTETTSKLGLAESKVGGLTARLEKFSGETKACVRELANCTDPAKAARIQERIGELVKSSASARSEMRAAAKEMVTLGKEAESIAKAGGMTKTLTGIAQKIDHIGHGASLALAPLEFAAMYMDCEKNNPGQTEQNVIKAASAFSGKMILDLATDGTKLNAVETAVGAMKAGMEMVGLKDTPAYDAVDVISQAFPMDVVSKGFGAAVDFGFAVEDYVSGDGKKMDQLFDANMKGKNGQVMQGLQVLTDLMMTGGKNIPTDPESIKFSQMFWNDGHTEVSSSNVGRNSKEKLRLLDQLMEGKETAPNDVLKIQQIVARSTPQQLDEVFVKINGMDLAKSLPPAGHTKDPAVSTFLDMAKIAGTAHAGQPDAPVWREMKMFVDSLKIQGRDEAIAELRHHLDSGHLKQIPGWLQQQIRW
jgi:LysM repeat protein